MRDLFREISDRAGQRDCATFEQALGALIGKLGNPELARRYGEILSDQLSS